MNSKVSPSRISPEDQIRHDLIELNRISEHTFYGSQLDTLRMIDMKYTEAGQVILRDIQIIYNMSFVNTTTIQKELNFAVTEIGKYATIQPEENALLPSSYKKMKDQIDACLRSVDTYLKNIQKSNTSATSALSPPGNTQQRRSLWELKRDPVTGHDIFIEYLDENRSTSVCERRYDPYSQKIYYFNKTTKKTQWENPFGKGSTTQHRARMIHPPSYVQGECVKNMGINTDSMDM